LRTDKSNAGELAHYTIREAAWILAFRDAKLIGKDESLRLVERAARVGDGGPSPWTSPSPARRSM
jgi:hypothetical protein